MKRTVAILVALMLLISCAAMADGPFGAYEEPITLTTCMRITETMQSFINIKDDVLSDNLWTRTFADELGINIAFDWTAPDTQYNDKMAAQLATNNLPDFFLVNAGQLKQLVDYGMVADLTDVFDEYAADFTITMMESDSYSGIEQATFDGKLYGLPKVAGNKDAANYWWIRYDWLENLGLEVPTTLDELLNVMYAFANDDPDGNGENDTYGMGMTKDLFGIGGATALGEGIGAYNGWVYTDEGKANGMIQPEMKELLDILAKLYADGVLDREFIVKDFNKLDEDIAAGKVGLFSGQHWLVFSTLQNSRTANPNAEWHAIPIVSKDGSACKTMVGGSASEFFVVNANCAHPEAVVKLYNLFYKYDPSQSPDYDLRYHGSLDSDPNSEITEWWQWSPIQSFYPMQNLEIHLGVDDYFLRGDESKLEAGASKDHIQYAIWYLAGEESCWSIYNWSGPVDWSGLGMIDYYSQNDMFLMNAHTSGDTDSMALYNATLNELITDTFTRIITGDLTIDAFDEFVTQWKDLGGDQITAEVNA